jgi:hypothetical protein
LATDSCLYRLLTRPLKTVVHLPLCLPKKRPPNPGQVSSQIEFLNKLITHSLLAPTPAFGTYSCLHRQLTQQSATQTKQPLVHETKIGFKTGPIGRRRRAPNLSPTRQRPAPLPCRPATVILDLDLNLNWSIHSELKIPLVPLPLL